MKIVIPKLINNALQEYWLLIKKPIPSGKRRVAHRFVHGMTWGILGGLVSRVFVIFSNIIVARLLGKTVYGELGIIQNTVGMFGIFAGLGLGMTATKYISEYRHKDVNKTERILGVSYLLAIFSGALISLGLVVLSPLLANKAIAAPHLINALKISSLLLFLGAITGAQSGALCGFEAFEKNAKINIIIGVLGLPITYVGVNYWGLMGAIWATIIVFFVNSILNHVALYSECTAAGIKLKFTGGWSEWPILWKYSFPATMSGIMVGPVTWTVSAMLVNRQNGYAEMGVFNAANQWRVALLFIPTIIGQIITPIMSEQLGAGCNNSASKALKAAMLMSGLIVIPAAILMGIFSPWIMLQYGPTFSNSWPVLLVVLATASLLAIQTPVGNIIAASGQMWVGTFMNAGWGVAVILFTWFLLPLGALGLALAFLFGYLVHGIWTFWYAWRTLSNQTC